MAGKSPFAGTVRIAFADDEIARFGNMLGALSEGDARKAMARAINRVTRTVEGRVVRAIARQSSIPVKIARRAIRSRMAAQKGLGPLYGTVSAIGAPLSLKHFRATQFGYGVRAKIWGKSTRFPGTFIWAGTYRSGKAVGNGHVFARTSKKSFPIELQVGPSVPEEMVKGESEKVFDQTVRTMLPARAMHEISRLLKA